MRITTVIAQVEKVFNSKTINRLVTNKKELKRLLSQGWKQMPL